MTATPIYQGQDFYAPQFEIKLLGQKLSQSVIRDVLEVSYRDSLDKLDSFEFTLHDWDPVRRVPKYSSPYKKGGEPETLANGEAAPQLDPGAKVELRMGYYGPQSLRLMLTGQIVSLSPSFPSSGTPTLRVRALSLLYTLQRAQEVLPFENKKDSEIAEEIARRLDIGIEIPPGQKAREQPHEYIMVNNEYPIIFLLGRARRLGYDMYVKVPEDGTGDPLLFFGKTPTNSVTYELTWGKSLFQFTPTLKTKGQISKVIVRGWNPRAQGNDRVITGEATWDDLDPRPDMPDHELLSKIDAALAETYEAVVDNPPDTQQKADEMARGILAEKVKDLVTGNGSTVGLADLRAGRTVIINGLGLRFSGKYLITETTHKLGNGGYATEFSARMEGPA
jgi:phage protein D